MLLKKYFLTLCFVFAFTAINVNAETIETQSPIYKDDIGRMHFLGKGGYSSVRPMQMGEAYSSAVNDATIKYTNVKNDAKKSKFTFINSI